MKKVTDRGLPYKCKHCGKVVYRESEKAWVKSWCSGINKMVHLVLMKEKK